MKFSPIVMITSGKIKGVMQGGAIFYSPPAGPRFSTENNMLEILRGNIMDRLQLKEYIVVYSATVGDLHVAYVPDISYK